jgi:hypothetical protein
VTDSGHARGMAFDAAVMIPRLKKRRVSVDYLARLAGLMRPDFRRDSGAFQSGRRERGARARRIKQGGSPWSAAGPLGGLVRARKSGTRASGPRGTPIFLLVSFFLFADPPNRVYTNLRFPSETEL